MLADFCCTRCGRWLRGRLCYRGQTVRCPGCAVALVVPKGPSAEAAALPWSDSGGATKVRAAAETAPRSARWKSRAAVPWLLLALTMLALALSMGARGYRAFVGSAAGSSAMPDAIPAQRRDSPAFISSISMRFGRANLGPTEGSNSGNGTRAELRPISHIGDFLAVAFAPQKAGGSAFTTTAAGTLRQFSYPDFHLRATYRLEQPAYRAVLDGPNGLLWVAACPPQALRVNGRGDRPAGCGDLHLYDVRALPPVSVRTLLPVRSSTEVRLHPRRVLPLGGEVMQLLLSPDHRRLFYLARIDRGIRVGRIDTAKEKLEKDMALPAEIRDLCLSPDGKTLYAAGAATLSVLDPDSLRLLRRVEVDTDAWSVTADNEGHVYLGSRGQWTDVTLVGLGSSQPSIKKWSAALHGRIYLKLAPDQYRLYLSSSSVISDQIQAQLVRGYTQSFPPQVGLALPDERGSIGGEIFLSPDGQFLASCRGQVFGLGQGPISFLKARLPSVPPIMSRMRALSPQPPG